jgi:hypothetical protein
MTDSTGRRLPGPRAEQVELPGRSFRIELIAWHDIVDVEVDGRRKLANRYWDPEGDRLSVCCQKGEVPFRNLQIRPLTNPPPTSKE